MRVQVLYTDPSGVYRIRADVREHNRLIHIIDIVDNEYGGDDIPLSDFTDEEMGKIQELILSEFDALNEDDDYDEEESEEESEEDY